MCVHFFFFFVGAFVLNLKDFYVWRLVLSKFRLWLGFGVGVCFVFAEFGFKVFKLDDVSYWEGESAGDTLRCLRLGLEGHLASLTDRSW